MKKALGKSAYRLKVFNDGSSAHIWTHPWKAWVSLSSKKDLTNSLLWNNKNKAQNNKKEKSDIDKFTSTFK